jgi:hypothetical protein
VPLHPYAISQTASLLAPEHPKSVRLEWPGEASAELSI